MGFCVVGERDDLFAFEIGNCFVEGFHQSEGDDFLHYFRIFFIAIFAERGVINLFFFVTHDDHGKTETEELVINQNASDAAVSVTKGMDCFEIEVKFGNFIGKISGVLTFIFIQNFFDHALNMFGSRCYMCANSYILPFFAKPAGNIVVDIGQEHLMEEENEFFG